MKVFSKKNLAVCVHTIMENALFEALMQDSKPASEAVQRSAVNMSLTSTGGKQNMLFF